MRNSKRRGVAGYIEGVDRLRTRELGIACYSEDMEGDVKGLGRGSYTGPEASGTRTGFSWLVVLGQASWGTLWAWYLFGLWAVGCGDPGGCALLVISAG
jgi:hypothetical protein